MGNIIAFTVRNNLYYSITNTVNIISCELNIPIRGLIRQTSLLILSDYNVYLMDGLKQTIPLCILMSSLFRLLNYMDYASTAEWEGETTRYPP